MVASLSREALSILPTTCLPMGRFPSSRRAPPPAPGERLRPVPIAEARPWIMRGTPPNWWTTVGRWCPVRLDGGHDPLGRRRTALSYEEDEHGRGRDRKSV